MDIPYVSHLSTDPDSTLFILRYPLLEGTALAHTMGTVNEVICGGIDKKFSTSVPQLIVNGDGGLSNRYFRDIPMSGFRVFLYIGSGNE